MGERTWESLGQNGTILWTALARMLKEEVVKDHVMIWISSVEHNESTNCVVMVIGVLLELGSSSLLDYVYHQSIRMNKE